MKENPNTNTSIESFYDLELELYYKNKIVEMKARIADLKQESAKVWNIVLKFNEFLGDDYSKKLKILQSKRSFLARLQEAIEEERQKRWRRTQYEDQYQRQYRYSQNEYSNYQEGRNETKQEEDKIKPPVSKKLKSAYRAAAMLCHPDVVSPELRDTAQKLFVQLNNAYKEGNFDAVEEILELLRSENSPLSTNYAAAIEDIDFKLVETAPVTAIHPVIKKLIDELKILEEELIELDTSIWKTKLTYSYSTFKDEDMFYWKIEKRKRIRFLNNELKEINKKISSIKKMHGRRRKRK